MFSIEGSHSPHTQTRRVFLARAAVGAFAWSVLGPSVPGGAVARADVTESCPIFALELDQLVQTVDGQIAGNCSAPDRRSCSFLLTSSQFQDFSANLNYIRDRSTAFSCASTSTNAELIALSGVEVELPGLLELYLQEVSSPRSELCQGGGSGSSAVAPLSGRWGLIWMAAALTAASILWLRRRRPDAGPAGLALAAAGATMLRPTAAQGQSIQLVDLIEESLGDRCLARILATTFNAIVPVDAAILLAQGLLAVKDDPDVAAALNGLKTSLEAIRDVLVNFSVIALRAPVGDALRKLVLLLSILFGKQQVSAAARHFVRDFGKLTARCMGPALVGVAIAKAFVRDWELVRTDCPGLPLGGR